MANAQGSLIRHFSDTLALPHFVPRNPSRLGPGRGTVSLPTSPRLGARQMESVWPEPPQSAQAFFNLPDPDPGFEPAPWYADTYPSSSDTLPLSLEEDFTSLPEDHTLFDGVQAQTPSSSGPAGGSAMRKKRAQVRIACTHCQKACKKCSNTRPCERCVKYGLKDCIDSTRKPRKTGVKRGPYKRRSSGKYTNGYYPSSSPPPSLPSAGYTHQPNHDYTYPQSHRHPTFTLALESPGNPSPTSETRHGGYTSPPSGYRLDPQLPNVPPPQRPSQHPVHSTHPAHLSLPPRQSLGLGLGNTNIAGMGMGIPPGPRTAALQGAFAQALSGPRWVHGQRTGPTTGGTEPMYPPTPVVPFPVSLHHRDDPFSRAVSPIHGDLDTALEGLKPGSIQDRLGGDGGVGAGHYGYTGQVGHDPFMGTEYSETIGGNTTNIEFTNPFDDPQDGPQMRNDSKSYAQAQSHAHAQAQAFSAPTSPKMTNSDWSTSQTLRSSSAESPSSSLPHLPPQIHPHPNAHPLSGTNDLAHSQGLVALTKIRKPSLRTLMSHGGSLAPSRQVSPVLEEEADSQSPTLFDQPMEMDDVDTVGIDDALGGWGRVKGEGRHEGTGFGGPFDSPFQA